MNWWMAVVYLYLSNIDNIVLFRRYKMNVRKSPIFDYDGSTGCTSTSWRKSDFLLFELLLVWIAWLDGRPFENCVI
jgi:hypothetical protein